GVRPVTYQPSIDRSAPSKATSRVIGLSRVLPVPCRLGESRVLESVADLATVATRLASAVSGKLLKCGLRQAERHNRVLGDFLSRRAFRGGDCAQQLIM